MIYYDLLNHLFYDLDNNSESILDKNHHYISTINDLHILLLAGRIEMGSLFPGDG